MVELPDGTVLLEKGELIPGYCHQFERFYPVARDTECSDCPFCGGVHVHAQSQFTYLKPPLEEDDAFPR